MNLKDIEQVRTYMLESENEADWDNRCETVCSENGGELPKWWFEQIVDSGLQNTVVEKWNGGLCDADLH